MARLAGLPDAVIERSREILRNLEADELTPEGLPRLAGTEVGPVDESQLSLGLGESPPSPTRLAEQEVLEALRQLDPDETPPLDALLALSELVRKLRGPPGRPESS